MAVASGPAGSGSGSGHAFPEAGALRGALLDVDGTLSDSDPLHLLAFQIQLKKEGFAQVCDRAFFNRWISGRHNPDIVLDLFPEYPEAERTRVYMEKEALFRGMCDGSIAEDGGPGDGASRLEAVAGLDRLVRFVRGRKLRVAAVTNAPRSNAELMLRGLGLWFGEGHPDNFFEELIIGAECAEGKPSPVPYQVAMDRLGLVPSECFCAEDSPSGMQAAHAAGLATFGVLTGQDARTLQAAGASLCVASWDDPKVWQVLNDGVAP